MLLRQKSLTPEEGGMVMATEYKDSNWYSRDINKRRKEFHVRQGDLFVIIGEVISKQIAITDSKSISLSTKC